MDKNIKLNTSNTLVGEISSWYRDQYITGLSDVAFNSLFTNIFGAKEFDIRFKEATEYAKEKLKDENFKAEIFKKKYIANQKQVLDGTFNHTTYADLIKKQLETDLIRQEMFKPLLKHVSEDVARIITAAERQKKELNKVTKNYSESKADGIKRIKKERNIQSNRNAQNEVAISSEQTVFEDVHDKHVQQRYRESAEIHSNRRNYTDMESFRYQLLKHELSDRYETWDLSETFIRGELIKWNDTNMKWESSFLDEETMAHLNENLFMDYSELELEASVRKSKYFSAINAYADISADVDIIGKYDIQIDEQGKPKSVYKDGLDIPKEEYEELSINKRLLEYETDNKNQTLNSNRKIDRLKERQKVNLADIEEVKSNLTKAEAFAEIQRAAALDRFNGDEETAAHMTKEINKKVELRRNELKALEERQIGYQNKIDIETANIKKLEGFYKPDTDASIRNEMLENFLKDKQTDLAKDLASKKKMYENFEPVTIKKDKVTPNDLRALYEEESIIKSILKRKDSFWNNKDKNVAFKEFGSEIEFLRALESVGGEDAKAILKGFYEYKDIDGEVKYAKKDFMVWENISQTVFDKNDNTQKTIKLDGIADIEEFNATPENINRYFTLTEHGENEMRESSNVKFKNDKERSEIIKIKEIIQQHKKAQRKLSDNERRAALIKLREIDDNTKITSEEMEKETSNNLSTTDKIEAKQGEESVKQAEEKAVNITTAEEVKSAIKEEDVVSNWVPDNKAKLLGSDTTSNLNAMIQRHNNEKATGDVVESELADMASSYKKVISMLSDRSIDIDNSHAKGEFAELAMRYEPNLSALASLDKYAKTIGTNDSKLIGNARQSIKEGLKDRHLISTPQIRYSMRKLQLYGGIDDISDDQLLSVLNDSMSNITKNIDKIDGELINLLESLVDYTPMTGDAKLLKEAWHNNEIEKIMYDDIYDKGIMQRPGVTQEDMLNDIFQNQKSIRDELDGNLALSELQDKILKNSDGRPFSIIQQKETAAVALLSKRNNDAFRLTKLNRSLTKEELMLGMVTDGVDEAMPVQSFLEFHELTSITDLGRDINLPFTNEEWEKGMVVFNEDVSIPTNQFYEYYNKDVRVNQRVSLATENAKSLLEIKDQKTVDINKKIQDFISSEQDTVKWMRREKLDSHKQEMSGKKTAISNNGRGEDIVVPAFRESDVLTGAKFKTKKEAMALLESKANPKAMHIADGVIGEVGIDNFDFVREIYNRNPKAKKGELMPVPKELQDAMDKYHSDIISLDESYKYKIDLPNKNIPPDNLTPDDYIRLYKFLDEEERSRLSKEQGGISRIYIKEKDVDKSVINTFKKVKENPNGYGLHLKHDAMLYDIVNMTDKTATIKSNHILANNIKLSISHPTEDILSLFDEINKKVKMAGEDYETNTANLDERIFFGTGKNTAGEESVRSIKRAELLDLLEKRAKNKLTVENAKGHLVKTNTHDIAYKVITSNFPWMLSDNVNSGSIPGLGYIAVKESIAEVTPQELQRAFDIQGLSTIDFASNDRELMTDAVENAISERVKGKILRGYMEDSLSGGGDKSTGLVRVAKKYIQSTGEEANTDKVQSVLWQMRNEIDKDPELKKHLKGLDRIINDRGEIAIAMHSESPNVSYERMGEIEYDLDDDTKLGRYSTLDDDTKDFLNLQSKGYKENFHNPEYMNEPQLEAKVEILKHEQAKIQANADAKKITPFSYNEFENLIRDKWVDKKLANHYRKLYGKNKVYDTYSSRNNIREIHEDTTNKFLELSSKKKVEEFNKKDLKSLTPDIKRKIEDIGKEDSYVQSVLDKIGDSENFLIDFKRELKKDFDADVLRRTEELLPTQEIAFKAIEELHKQDGAAVVQQYITLKGGETGFAGGLRGIVPDDVLKGIITKTPVFDSHDYKYFAMLADIMPGLKVTATATDANGNVVRFDTKDAKRNFQGNSGTVIQTNTGEILPIVDHEDQAKKELFLSNINPEEVDYQRKTAALYQQNIPLIVTTKKDLSVGKNQYAVLTDSKINFDSVTARANGGFGIISPVQNLHNFTNLIDNGGKAITIDFETTGLPNKMKPGLFQAIQVAIQDVDVSKNGDEVVFDADENIKTKYLAPTQPVYDKVLELNDTSAIPTIANNISDRYNPEVGLLRNYAKYDNEEIEINGEKMTKGDLFTSDVRVMERGLNGEKTSMVQIAKSVGDSAPVWTDTGYSPTEFATKLSDSAFDIASYLKNDTTKVSRYGIDKADIFSTEKDFVNFVMNESKGKYNIGHNISGADAPWLETWGARSGVDTTDFSKNLIDTLELSKINSPGRKVNKLASLKKDMGINVDGMAHLADVDVAVTTKVAENLANSDSMKSVMENVRTSLTQGDFFVKIGEDDMGIKGLEKGAYEFISIDEVSNGKDSKIPSQKVTVKNVLDGNTVEFFAPNTSSIQREASNNWIRFNDKDSAKTYNDALMISESNRTLENAITKGDTWDLYKTRGIYKNTQPVIDRLTALKTVYEDAQNKAVTNLGGAKKWNSIQMNDAQNFALANSHKLSGGAFDKEIARLSKEISPRRMGEFEAFATYANTEEGMLVDTFLKKGRDRLQAGVIDKDTFNHYSNNVHGIIKDIKSKGVKEGRLAPEQYTFSPPNTYTAGEVTGDVLNKYGGNKYNLSLMDSFNLNLDFSNRTSLENSMWGAVDKLAKRIVKSPDVKNIGSAKSIALNQFIMPIVGQHIGDSELKESILQNQRKALSTGIESTNIVDPSNSYTLPAAADHMFKNKEAYLETLSPTTEINTLMPINSSNNEVDFQELNKGLAANLESLDNTASMVPVRKEDRIVMEASPVVRRMNDQLTAMQEVNRINSNKIMSSLMGDELQTDVAIPFSNTNFKSSDAQEIANTLMKAEEINLINPISTEYGVMEASDLKSKADAIRVEEDILTPGQFNYMLHNPETKNKAFEMMPGYVDILKEYKGENTDYITHINDKTILNEMNNRVRKPMLDAVRDNKSKKADMYREIYNRATQYSKYPLSPDMSNPDATLKNKNYTKYKAMKELGYIQTDTNAMDYTGPVGLPGKFKVGQELDPSKVFVVSSGTKSKGEYTGLTLTDLTTSELEDIANNPNALSAEKEMISAYLNQPGINSVHTNELAIANRYDAIDKIRTKQSTTTISQQIGYSSNSQGSLIKDINEGIIDGANNTPARNAINGTSNIIPESHFTQVTRDARRIVNDVGSNIKSVAKEIAGSSATKYGLAALAFAGAMALTKQYTSDGGTPEQRPKGNQAPTVDGSYDSEYNNNEGVRNGNPKTVRLEENGKGMNIKVRAKNRGIANDRQVEGALSDAMNSTLRTQINIRQTDDRQSINAKSIQDLFSQALSQ